MNRRQFLLRTGWVAGGITVLTSCSMIPAFPSGFGADEDILSWVKLLADGTFEFYCPRAEMGQGIDQGLSLVVAEELKIDPSVIRCLLPSTNQINKVQNTVGSMSMENYFKPVALAAANLRERLRTVARLHAANAKLGFVPVLVEGGFKLDGNQVVTYADLVQDSEEAIILTSLSDPAPELRSVTQQYYIGQKSPEKPDRVIEQIVHGKPIYVRDVVVPQMKFGAVLKPPYMGAKLISVDKDSARGVRSVLGVFDGPDGLPGIVAETPMALRKAVETLDPVWQALSDAAASRIHPDLDIDKAIKEDRLGHELVSVSTDEHQADVNQSLNIRFDSPMMAHAAMEPRCGVALVITKGSDKGAKIWTASQDPFYMRSYIAKLLGQGEQSVEVQNHRLGGAFGGRILCQATAEAAWLSKAAMVPVKVQWSREDEFSMNYVGPAFSHRLQVDLNGENKILNWQHQLIASPIMFTSAMIPSPVHWILDKVDDPGVGRGAAPIYDIPNQHVNFESIRTVMPTGAWRGLGAAPNTFASERTMDELAKLADEDQIDFRLGHINDDRLAAVIKKVRAISGWQSGSSNNKGFACTIYKQQTYVALVAETEWQGDTAVIKHLWCAQDCGRAISPDRIRAQIEGCLTWGISMALLEVYQMEAGKTISTNFDRYPIARQQHSCPMDIHIMSSTEPPVGSGEAAFAPAAAAMVNALGRVRHRSYNQLPLSVGI